MLSGLIWLPGKRSILKPFNTITYDNESIECYEVDIFHLMEYMMKKNENSPVIWYNFKYIIDNYGPETDYKTTVHLYPEGNKYSIFKPGKNGSYWN